MNLTMRGVRLAYAKAWLPQAGRIVAAAELFEIDNRQAQATLLFESAEDCEQLADAMTDLAQQIRTLQNPSKEDETDVRPQQA